MSSCDQRARRGQQDRPGGRDGRTPPRATRLVRWLQTSATEPERRQAARRIAALVVGLPLPRLDFGAAAAAAPFNPRARNNDTKVAEPLSYRRLGIDDPEFWRELVESPYAATRKTGCADVASLTFEQMERDLKTRRRPATIHVRPGQGGKQHTFESSAAHAIVGLEDYGEISWRRASRRAELGLIELDPAGNTIVACRLSGTEVKDGETFINQLGPNMGLVKMNEELRVRYLLFALHMPGTRQVRQDRLIPVPDAEREGERDDINLILEAIHAGWCDHVVFRDGGRVARDVLPAEQIVRHLKSTGTGLWLAELFKKVDYRRDRLQLRATNVISAENRDVIVTNMARGLLNKGPLAGRGWTTSKRFGFVRQGRTKELAQDMEQWPYIRKAFQLASSGDCLDSAGGLSMRALEDELSRQGCPVDHDRLRTLLKDEIYVTGHHTVNVRGQLIAQEPVPLEDPVPLDEFQRVQVLLELRQGSTKRTPLGEFLLNYVHTEHTLCNHVKDKQGRRPSIKGYILNNQPEGDRRYRHNYHTPEQCRRHTWSREELEHPIIEEVRKLAQEPLLVEQLVLAARHDAGLRTPTASEADIPDIEHQLEQLEQQLQAATDQFVLNLQDHERPLDAYTKLVDGMLKRKEQLNRRLASARRSGERNTPDATSQIQQDRLNAFLAIMTLDPPSDPYLKALRARLFQECVSAVRIGYSEDGAEWIEVQGPLVPGSVDSSFVGPVARCADLLDQHLRGTVDSAVRDDDGCTLDAAGDGDAAFETDLAPNSTKSVSKKVNEAPESAATPYPSALPADDYLPLPSVDDLRRRDNELLEATAWHKRSAPAPEGWHASWSRRLDQGALLLSRTQPMTTRGRSFDSLRRAQQFHESQGGIGLIGCEAYRRLRSSQPQLRLITYMQLRKVAREAGLPTRFSEWVAHAVLTDAVGELEVASQAAPL